MKRISVKVLMCMFLLPLTANAQQAPDFSVKRAEGEMNL